jgi:hypothetical protein
MKSQRLVAIALVGVATILLPMTLAAQREGKRPEADVRGLGLDEAQMERMEQIGMEHRLGMIDLRAEREKIRLEIRGELVKAKPDRAELDRLVEALGAVRVKMEKQRIDHLLKVRGVLNDDQWKRFLKSRRGGMGRGPMGRGRRAMHQKGHGGPRRRATGG